MMSFGHQVSLGIVSIAKLLLAVLQFYEPDLLSPLKQNPFFQLYHPDVFG